MAKGPVRPIDYTGLGYEPLRDGMLALARESLPEWTDHGESDLGVLLVELFAYAADVTLYYQTRIAANLLPATADEPEALVQLLRLIGYELSPPAPATANLRVGLNAAGVAAGDVLTIPRGTRFTVSLAGGEQVPFETERDLAIRGSQLTPPPPGPAGPGGVRFYTPVPVVQGTTVSAEGVARSDGSPAQTYALRGSPVIAGSIEVSVDEPGGSTTRWRAVESLAASTPADRHFMVQRDATGAATLLFGDGGNGMIPPRGAPVSATYRTGGGTLGNVPAGTRFAPSIPLIREAFCESAAAGGTEAEPLERARYFAPRLFRTQDRAVTLDDYVDLALQLPGVGKARAVAPGWNEVVLFVAPAGRVAEPSELLKRDLLDFFERRRMATTQLRVRGPQEVDVYLRAEVRAQPYFLQSAVRAAVERAVAAYLDFDAVDFGQPIYLSKVYDAIQSLEEVASLTVTEFGRVPGGGIETDGILELGPHELPRPGYRDNPLTPDPLDPGNRPPILVTLQGGVPG